MTLRSFAIFHRWHAQKAEIVDLLIRESYAVGVYLSKMKSSGWKHYKTVVDGEACLVEGVNIWNYEWKNTYEIIAVIDPIYSVKKSFHKFFIELENKNVYFVAGEFSNCIWGIYLKQDFKSTADNE